MKKCKCGNEMEDWMTLCKECYSKQQASQPENKERQESIERQVAGKCAAMVLQGTVATEENVVRVFNVFLKLIRG